MKKSSWMVIVFGILFCFLFSSNATASRIEATLGWHNLMDDFYLVVEGSKTYFADGDKIRRSKLRGSSLEANNTIDLRGLELGPGDSEMWRVDTARKFDKWINKKTRQKLKKAAKNQQRDEFGKKNGWKGVYREWRGIWKGLYDDEDLWSLYEKNIFIHDAFNELEGKKINGRIGDIKFKAYLNIFANPFDGGLIDAKINPVPEPATMVLFGLGLLGLAGVSRRKFNDTST